ncbi:MAG: ISAs1 family transposase [Bacillota bacterium]
MTIFPPEVKTLDKAHGRSEIRRLRVSSKLKGYVEFPHVERVFRIERTRIINKTGERSDVCEYGITSLTEKQADDSMLLNIIRGHWTIENKVHYVRDMAFDEDRSQVRTKNGPRVMAIIRNLVMNILRMLGVSNITQCLRENALKHSKIFEMLGLI